MSGSGIATMLNKFLIGKMIKTIEGLNKITECVVKPSEYEVVTSTDTKPTISFAYLRASSSRNTLLIFL